MILPILSFLWAVFGVFFWGRACFVLDKARREREEAEVEHRAAEVYWAWARKQRRRRR